MKNNAILDRVSDMLEIEDIDKKIASLPAGDFQSILLFIFEEKTRNWSLREMFDKYLDSRFVGISSLSQKKLVQLDGILYSLLPQNYEAIEFSPVVPFGTNSLLASTNQKNVMSTVRNLEVVADPTTALAIECAKRRSKNARENLQIHLATSHRCIRLQNFDEIPGFTPHFRIFAMASSSKNENPFEFEIEMLLNHMKYYLDLLNMLPDIMDCEIKNISVSISNINIAEYLINMHKLDRNEIGRLIQDPSFSLFGKVGIAAQPKVTNLSKEQLGKIEGFGIDAYLRHLKMLQKKIDSKIKPFHPKIVFEYDLDRAAGIGYYENLCLRITAENRNGNAYPLVDGGSTNWLKKLLTSKKERFFISGIGTELLLQNFCL